MRNLRKPYQMYVLNLDGARIFWLTTILLFLIALSFFIGLFIGQEKAHVEVDDISLKNKVMMDEIIDKLDNKTKEDKEDEEYQFYELISPRKITEDEDLPTRLSEMKSQSTRKKPVKIEKVDSHTGDDISIKKSLEKPEPVLESGDQKLNTENPYAVQVASYNKYDNAVKLRDYLKAEQYPSYIIKSVVEGKKFFRVRVGPFASRSLSLKVIEMIRHKKGCQDSFIVASN